MGSEPRAIDYEMNMDLAPAGYPHAFTPYAGAIRVKCGITLSNPGPEPIDKVDFILYRLLGVRQVSGPGGEALRFSEELRDFDGIENLQVRTVHVSLAEPIALGRQSEWRHGGRTRTTDTDRLAVRKTGENRGTRLAMRWRSRNAMYPATGCSD